jgi:cytochrome c oxidase subunit 2
MLCGSKPQINYWLQLGFLDGFVPIIDEFIFFHDFTNIILVFIITYVCYIIFSILFNKIIYKGLLHGQVIECVWTTIPGLILIQIALPSLSLLYLIEDSPRPNLTIKAIGHQWYWEYEYTDFWAGIEGFSFDSYIFPEGELELGIFRQLETDNRVALPILRKIRVLVSRADVLHSWTIPSLGVKADAIPGRINQLNFISVLPGVLYGQCSEICGRQHSNIPICVELLKLSDFNLWVTANSA